MVHPEFAAVERTFRRLMGSGAGGGALVVRMRGETVVDITSGTADRAGSRPWTRDTAAVSFSTTKGISSTVIHRLADRGLIGYDEPVATYWPAFGAAGKGAITVRHLLTHRAGLHRLSPVATRAEDLLDHEAVEARLAALPSRGPTATSAYHAITYGFLVAGLARAVTGEGMRALVTNEVARPLGIEGGLHIGIGPGERVQAAEPVGGALRRAGALAQATGGVWRRLTPARAAIEALHVPGFHRLFEGARPPIWSTEMPAVNGLFTAGALARVYGALANGGEDAGTRLLSPGTVDSLGRVQVRTRDAVLGMAMRWRLGYHHAFGIGREASHGFGHYGFGGSGAWAEPTLGLSLGFVTNRIGALTTPLGDLTLFRLSGAVRECAVRLAGPAPGAG